MSDVQVFVSFDVEHDQDLYDLLVAHSRTPSSGFCVSSGSKRTTTTSLEGVRREIRGADQVIVICGEHTQTSTRVSTELEIAKQEETPYLLLWGRRDSMCSKPAGVKTAEGMYSWTREVLQDQMSYTARQSAAASVREAHRKR